MHRVGRSLGLAVATMAIIATTLVAPTVPLAGATPVAVTDRAGTVGRLQEPGAAEEQAFVDKINQLRTSLGLVPLTIDPELTAQARIWSQTMKDAGKIFHTGTLDAGITADWEKLGENVGVGGTVDALFDAFVASPKHYENLVDPSYRFIGVGVVWDGGRMFTAHRFMSLMPPAPVTTAPPRRSAPTDQAPPPVAPEELTATDPPSTTTTTPVPAPPPPPVVPPAQPNRISLVLATVDGLLD